jgi:hypothetical protein
MAWSGWPTTPVSQLTFTEWNLTLRPGREVLVGYTLSYLGVWHVFGDDKWVWFNGVIRGSSGAIEIVRQWAEAENLGLSHRHWRWVHWRNPSSETVYASARFVLAPPVDDRDLRATGQDSRTKRIWTIGDFATTDVHAFGFFTPGDDDDDDDSDGGRDEGTDGGRDGSKGSGRNRERGIVPGIALRALEGQRLQTIELTGDDRFLPLEELDARVDRLRGGDSGYGGSAGRP